MCRNSRCSQLRDDDLPVGDDTGKPGCFDSADQFIGTERAFSGSAPDIDPFGIQHKDVRIESRKGRTQGIEAQCIIRRGKDRGFRSRVAEPVEARFNPVPDAVYTPAGKEMVEPVGKRDGAVSFADFCRCGVPELQLQGDAFAIDEHEQLEGWEDVIKSCTPQVLYRA